MIEITLALMATLIATMFVTTAVSSIVAAVREGKGLKEASARRMAF